MLTCREDDQLQKWKEEMGYEDVKEAMMKDAALDRFCMPVGEMSECVMCRRLSE